MLLKTTYGVGIVFAISIFAVTLFTGAEEVRAECVCYSDSPAEALEEADAVFIGVVVEKGRAQQFFSCDGPNLRVEPPVSSGGSYPVKLQVSTVWKGRVRETMIVRAGGGCGFDFSVGTEYLVYARGSFVSVCRPLYVPRERKNTYKSSDKDQHRSLESSIQCRLDHRHHPHAQQRRPRLPRRLRLRRHLLRLPPHRHHLPPTDPATS